MKEIIKHRLYNIKVGDNVCVEGRFIPENQLHKIRKDNPFMNFPQIGLNGTIKTKINYDSYEVDDEYYVVYFDEIDMELPIPSKDILCNKKNNYNKNYVKLYKIDNDKEFYIFIDSNDDNVIFSPYDYLDDPYVEIRINNLFFSEHLKSGCIDCNEFYNDLGTNKKWFIEYNDKIYRLDLREFNSKKLNKNSLIQSNCYFDNGTTFKLILIT
jgi:hypothetical protein